ncbi:hypothetical protein G7076_02980 [Sphingomonas sp. HDW15A]|uniref:hypothetical protein n=1 Tax=Sphingomonas sp. HDW15A TaxID=2714942 RepID=UPI001408081D|nr:hypothetical protein [Sphingomonas sp. HDW15A]QIK95580.1 hypothetical protein G7076_02980 [Sphingomonas sp. HDW15A]
MPIDCFAVEVTKALGLFAASFGSGRDFCTPLMEREKDQFLQGPAENPDAFPNTRLVRLRH